MQTRPPNLKPFWVLDVQGRSLEEVERKVARIQMGNLFTALKQFDQCLCSWCVLNGRVTHKVKTPWNFGLRVCRYSSHVRCQWHVGLGDKGDGGLSLDLEPGLVDTKADNTSFEMTSTTQVKALVITQARFLTPRASVLFTRLDQHFLTFGKR